MQPCAAQNIGSGHVRQAGAVLLAVALVSGLIPAIRAARVDAAGALRSAA